MVKCFTVLKLGDWLALLRVHRGFFSNVIFMYVVP